MDYKTMGLWVAAVLIASVSVTVWIVTTHAQHPHKGVVTERTFMQFLNHEKEWREEIRHDIREMKQLLRQYEYEP